MQTVQIKGLMSLWLPT